MRRACVALLAGAVSVALMACVPALPGGSTAGCPARNAILLAGYDTATTSIGPNSVKHTFDAIAPALSSLYYPGGPAVYAGDPVYFSYRYRNAYTTLDTHDALPSGVDALHATVVDVLKGCPQASLDLIGHSLGGVVAWEYVVQYGNTDEGRHIAHVITLDSPVNGLSKWPGVLGALSPTAEFLLYTHDLKPATTNIDVAVGLSPHMVIRTFASEQDSIVLPADALIAKAPFQQPVSLPQGCPSPDSVVGLLCLHGQILQDAGVRQAIMDTLLLSPSGTSPPPEPASLQPSISPVPLLSSSAPASSQPSASPQESGSPPLPPSSPGTPASQPSVAATTANCSGVQFTYHSNLAKAVTGTLTQNGGGIPFIRCELSGYPATAISGRAVEVYLVSDFANYVKQQDQLIAIRSGSMDPGVLAKQGDLPWIDPVAMNYGGCFMIRPQRLGFRNGTGVRFLVQFTQDPGTCWPGSGYTQYFYQGLASDSQYFVMARFDLRSPVFGQRCGDTTNYPTNLTAFRQCMDTQVSQLANVADSQFQPNLTEVDDLVKSISVSANAVQALKIAPRPSCRPPNGPFQQAYLLQSHPDAYLANLIPAALPQSAPFIVAQSLRADRGHFAFKVSPQGVDSRAAKAAFLDWLKLVCLTDDQIAALDITYSPSSGNR